MKLVLVLWSSITHQSFLLHHLVLQLSAVPMFRVPSLPPARLHLETEEILSLLILQTGMFLQLEFFQVVLGKETLSLVLILIQRLSSEQRLIPPPSWQR